MRPVSSSLRRISPLILILCSVSVSASAEPTGVGDALSRDTLRRAHEALQGDPAESKIELLPEASEDGRPSDLVYVLPLRSEAKLTLATLASPQCELLEATAQDINRAVDALALLAQSVVGQANRISEQIERHAEFTLAHRAELDLASEGLAKVAAADAVVTELAAALLAETDPTLIAFYSKELATAQGEAAAARSDPQYAVAFSVKAQADALMDSALEQHARWESEYSAILDSANTALEVAQALYDDLSRTELAATETRMPVWDSDVRALLDTSQGLRKGIRFVPATLEELSWTIQDADLPRSAPIEIETFGIAQEQLLGATRVEPLPGLLDRKPLHGAQPLPNDVATSTTAFAQGALGRTLSRDTQQLTASAPLIRASVPLGSYCGSLHSVETEPLVVSGPTTSSSLRVRKLEFSPRQHSSVETYLGTLDYKVKVRGLPTDVLCTFEMAKYARNRAGSSRSIEWLLRDSGEWDYLLLEQLRHLGLACTSSSITDFPSLGMGGMVREAVSWAASDLMDLVAQFSVPNRAMNVTLANVRLSSGERGHVGQSILCAKAGCGVPELPPAGTRRNVLGARVTSKFRWAEYFWKSVQMQSEIEFAMPR